MHDVTSALMELQGRADFLIQVCTDSLNHASSDDELSARAIKSCVGVMDKLTSSTLKNYLYFPSWPQTSDFLNNVDMEWENLSLGDKYRP